MDERIAKHAADIGTAAVSARELARLASALSSDVGHICGLADQVVNQVRATSMSDDTIASFETAVAELDGRTSTAQQAEASLAAARDDLAARETAVADREKAADARKAELDDLTAGLEAREKKLADEAAAKVNADGNKQPE